MVSLILFGVFFLLLFLNIPIGLSLGISSVAALLYEKLPLSMIPSNLYSSTGKFVLLAIPFFILGGNVMEKSGISSRLINFCRTLVGHKKSGMAMVCVIVSCFFAAISGSGPATVAALGMIIIPAMTRVGYDKASSAALMSTAGAIGIIIPPSITFVIYGSITGKSVGALFASGILPGLLMGFSLILAMQFVSRDRPLDLLPKASWPERWKNFKEAFWGLMMPVIILGCIYGGITTTTEAAAIATAYAIPVGFFIYKKLTYTELKNSFIDAAKATGTIMLLTLTVQMLSRMFIDVNLPKLILNAFYSVTDNRWGIMLMINLFMIVLGMLMDDTSGCLLATPILVPIIKELGFSPVHFAAILAVNLGMGNITPPVAPLLYFSSRIIDAPLKEMLKPTLIYFLFAWLPTLLLTIFVPGIATWLPQLFGYAI